MDPKLSGSLERVATIYVTYIIVKYGTSVPGLDQSIVPDIIIIGGSAISAAWGIYKNRKSALVSTAAAVPGVSKIELTNTPEGRALSTATPDNVNVKGDQK
jgi:hypothetical protein